MMKPFAKVLITATRVLAGFVIASVPLFAQSMGQTKGGGWQFTDVTVAAGLNFAHGYHQPDPDDEAYFSGGVAVGDFDRDGWVDIYMVRGDLGPNMLFKNMGDGTFVDVAAQAGVAINLPLGTGPLFGDIDGDGWLDLWLGSASVSTPMIYRNLGNGTFAQVQNSGMTQFNLLNAGTFGDYDLDGDLDLFMSQWNLIDGLLLWRNDGNFQFTNVSATAFSGFLGVLRSTFTPNFSDINNDGWPDLVVAADFGRSQVMHNSGQGHFTLETSAAVITDEHGMGASVGDYDNDGDMDWFVTSIYYDGPNHPGTGITGNRLYQNQGDGSFTDVTDIAGVRIGHWGWGAVFADLDNDGDQDIYQVNGWRKAGDHTFENDPNLLYVNQGNGSFVDMAASLGTDFVGQGRGVVAFDYDRDGDLDLFLANNSEEPKLYRNDLTLPRRYLQIHLTDKAPNAEGIGAWLHVKAGPNSQWQEMRCGNNYLSQNPAMAHFGLDQTLRIDHVTISWLRGVETVLRGLATNQNLTISSDVISSDSFESVSLETWQTLP